MKKNMLKSFPHMRNINYTLKQISHIIQYRHLPPIFIFTKESYPKNGFKTATVLKPVSANSRRRYLYFDFRNFDIQGCLSAKRYEEQKQVFQPLLSSEHCPWRSDGRFIDSQLLH